ncbi:cyclic nucleotide-binding domain-containing protein 1 isoform X1 [Anguilla anguilla]|uniref:cyclic nucleotide-binding domain-containing protein 1 isoform X1 n=1 Tax=Anguilla anguilla TaxID=7936 RepID=UPI0015AC8EFB|nr:cyclic nucleotide-binding domain-containing protein 1 isoform X1 [Anguilla anguilla]
MSLQASTPSLQYCDDQIVIGIDYTHLEALCGVSGLGDGGSDSKSTEEAHKDFMSSYQKIFLRPKKVIPRVPLPSNCRPVQVPVRGRRGGSNASWDMRQSQGHSRQARDHLIGQTLRALRKLPIERSLADQQAIRRTLNAFPCLSTLLSNQELQQISSIAILESWEREQTIFGHNGLHLVLRGTVRLYSHEATKTDTMGVGGCFGSLEEQDTDEAHADAQHAVTLDNCEILRIPRAAYAKLQQEIEAQNSALRESIVQSCPFYLHWHKLSIKKLSDLIQMRQLPANHVLVREGEVCPFVTYIRTGECNILRDIEGVPKREPGKKGNRVKYVVVGKLGPGASFGETSVLLDQPSPCSVVTATEVKMGVILPSDLKGLDSVTRSLIEQTEQPAYGKLSQEQMNKMYVAQERQKEWLHIKRRVLRDALFYNGIVQGCGKWNQIRVRRDQDTHRNPPTSSL